jgi:hypothetical protein
VRPGASFRLDCCFDVVRHDTGILLLAELGLDRHLLLYTPSSVVDPATGSDAPVPADLGRWLADHPGLDASAPVPLSLGGLDGITIEGVPQLDADFNAEGDLVLMRATAVSRFAIGSDARFRIAVLDAPDGPLVVAVVARADGYDAFSAKAETFLTSLQLGR